MVRATKSQNSLTGRNCVTIKVRNCFSQYYTLIGWDSGAGSEAPASGTQFRTRTLPPPWYQVSPKWIFGLLEPGLLWWIISRFLYVNNISYQPVQENPKDTREKETMDHKRKSQVAPNQIGTIKIWPRHISESCLCQVCVSWRINTTFSFLQLLSLICEPLPYSFAYEKCITDIYGIKLKRKKKSFEYYSCLNILFKSRKEVRLWGRGCQEV